MNYQSESVPFVIREDVLVSWPSFRWSLQDWADKCQDAKLTFRVHNINRQDRVNWENEAVNYVEATVQQLVGYILNEKQLSSSEPNPFAEYSLDQYCFYSGYNYMNKLFHQEHHKEVLDSVRWCETELGEPKLQNDASNSTLWIGTGGAYTPCHMDTYGYNFVAQLYGKKLWILFPPSDTANLYATRIPYEESSIFSQVNFQCIDLHKFPLLKQTKPRIIELKAGEILFVPRHWWHFVENVPHTTENSISISVNTWLTGDEHDNSLSESLVQFLTRPLIDAYGDSSWLNLNADLFSAQQAAHILKELVNRTTTDENLTDDCEQSKKTKKIRTLIRHYLEIGSFEDIARLKNIKNNEAYPKEKQELTMRDIVNCILDPEVIDLIKCKLKRCAQ